MTTAIATAIKLMEALPEPAQAQVVEHLREYVLDLRDEERWDESFKSTQPQLITAARRARKEIAAGFATPFDLDQL